MKKLTYEGTNHRNNIIQKARHKYSGVTSNITEALRMYLANDAGPDEQIPLRITTPEQHQLREILKSARPNCDECSELLRLKINAADQQGQVWPTAWVCENCGIEYYSDKTPAEWLKELKFEAGKQNLRDSDEPIQEALPAMQEDPPL